MHVNYYIFFPKKLSKIIENDLFLYFMISGQMQIFVFYIEPPKMIKQNYF